LIVLPPPCPLSVAPFDFSQADLLISRALADTREFLDRRGAPLPRVA
jgi:NTE family protein